MTDAPPPGGPDRDAFGQPVQTPPQGPPGYPPQHWYPAYPPIPSGMPPHGDDADSSRTKAVWALVLAILPLCGISWIVSVVLAILVLAGPNDGRRRGRGMAWASIVIVVVWIIASVVAAVLVIALAPADRDDDGEVTSEGEVFAEDLQVGDCFSEDLGSGEDEVYTVSATPCDEPHNAEVFHEFDLDDGDYPAESDIWDLADEGCYAAFEPWVGQSYEDSDLDFSYYYPTIQSWKYDDRAISCVVLARDDVTGTLEGSGR
ncbi:DUF4190 domain-containing protein [Aeromicrobium sp. Sec7.5]|uniref:DUF4190 domain-containing protein n=1 Tax=Aeromicrobium sp. Sec7.5 TaxID=3121276 RepID=UPI002FE4D8C8